MNQSLNNKEIDVELTIEDMEAVNGGSFFRELVLGVKLAYHLATGTPGEITHTLP
jgi:hypothetical protein